MCTKQAPEKLKQILQEDINPVVRTFTFDEIKKVVESEEAEIMYKFRQGILSHLDQLVQEVPNLVEKLIALFMFTITTYSYIESVVVDVFVKVVDSANNSSPNPVTYNSPAQIHQMIKNLMVIVRTGYASKYETDLRED